MPDLDFFIRIAGSIISLLLVAGLGCFIGAVIETRNWTKFASFLARPLVKAGRLPDVCSASFLTAVVSNNAANSMIAGAYSDGKISRKEMLLSAIANSFPTKVYHMLKVIFIVIPLLGYAGALYYAIQVLTGFIRTVVVLLIARFTHKPHEANIEDKRKELPSWSETFSKAKKRTLRLLKRIAMIAAPIYLTVSYLAYLNIFSNIQSVVPESLSGVFSQGVITIMASRLADLISSAKIARDLIDAGDVNTYQVVIALLAGNIITTPFRTIRRNLATATGIFPGKDGIWIVGVVQGSRIICAIIAIIVLYFIQ